MKYEIKEVEVQRFVLLKLASGIRQETIAFGFIQNIVAKCFCFSFFVIKILCLSFGAILYKQKHLLLIFYN